MLGSAVEVGQFSGNEHEDRFREILQQTVRYKEFRAAMSSVNSLAHSCCATTGFPYQTLGRHERTYQILCTYKDLCSLKERETDGIVNAPKTNI